MADVARVSAMYIQGSQFIHGQRRRSLYVRARAAANKMEEKKVFNMLIIM